MKRHSKTRPAKDKLPFLDSRMLREMLNRNGATVIDRGDTSMSSAGFTVRGADSGHGNSNVCYEVQAWLGEVVQGSRTSTISSFFAKSEATSRRLAKAREDALLAAKKALLEDAAILIRGMGYRATVKTEKATGRLLNGSVSLFVRMPVGQG